MVSGLFKYAVKLILTDPRIRKEAGKFAYKAYTKTKPILDEKSSILKKRFKENSSFIDPFKFKNDLKKNFKKPK